MADSTRARIDDPEKLAADANRTVKARAPFKPFVPTSAPVDQPAAGLQPSHFPEVPFRVGASSLAPSHVPITPEPLPVNPVTGVVTPKFNLGAAFNQAEVPTGAGGERLVPFTPPVDTTPVFAGAATPTTTTPLATPAVTPVGGPAAPEAAPGFSIEGPVQQPRGFSLDDLLTAAGPAQTGLGTIAALGAGSALVAQNESQIQTGISRDRAAAADVREEATTESEIASRGAQAGVAEETATKIGVENRINALRVSQGLAPVGDRSETFKTSVIPADIVSGTPAQILRAGSGGASQLRPASEGGFPAATTAATQDPTAVRIAAIDGFKANNPAFKDSTDQEVLNELQRQFEEQSAQ